jgi:hypothetical protein
MEHHKQTRSSSTSRRFKTGDLSTPGQAPIAQQRLSFLENPMSRAKSRRPVLSAAFVRACASNSRSRAAIPIAPSCGDTIGPGVSYRLTADVGPCNAGAGLIID